MQIEFVPKGLVIPPWDTRLRLPFDQAELLHRGTSLALPSGMQVSEDYAHLFDDDLIGIIRHLGYWGGRGGAKSWVAVLAAVLRMRRFTNYKVANIRQHQISLDQSMHALYKGTIRRLGVDDEFSITDNTITHLATRSTAIFKGIGVNTDNIRSLEDVDLCLVEEAAQLTKHGIDTLIPTIRTARAQFIWIWNPNEDGPRAVDLRFRIEPLPDDCLVKQVNFNTSNPHWFFASLVKEERTARRTPDSHAHIWLGQYPQESEALIFKPSNWSIGHAFVPNWAEPRFGMDFGFSPDPTVFVRLWVIEPEEVGEQGIIYVSECVHEIGLATNQLADFLKQVPMQTGADIWCDCSEPRTITDLAQMGVNAMAAPKGQGSVKAGIKFLQGYHIRISPDCELLIHEAKNYRHKVDKATGRKLPELAQTGHDHAWDAVRYALWDYIKLANGGIDYADITPFKTHG